MSYLYCLSEISRFVPRVFNRTPVSRSFGRRRGRISFSVTEGRPLPVLPDASRSSMKRSICRLPSAPVGQNRSSIRRDESSEPNDVSFFRRQAVSCTATAERFARLGIFQHAAKNSLRIGTYRRLPFGKPTPGDPYAFGFSAGACLPACRKSPGTGRPFPLFPFPYSSDE